MKRNEQRFQRFLNRAFGPFLSVPQQQVDSACERVLNRLRDEPDGPLDNAAGDFVAVRRPRSWFRPALALSVAVVTIVVVLQFSAIRDSTSEVDAHAVVESADAGLYRVSGEQALEAGDRIEAGETVRTNGGVGAVLKLADGTAIEMRSESKLSLQRADDGIRIRLDEGDMIVNATRQPSGRHLYVQTRDLTVSVVGTVFLVSAEEQGSRVAVLQGEVRVKKGSTEERLLPGEQLDTNSRMELLPFKEEVAWSRQAGAHLALLAQSTAVSPESREVFDVISIRRRPGPSGGGERGAAGDTVGTGGRCEGKLQLDPGRFAATNAGIYFLITLAYGLGDGLGEPLGLSYGQWNACLVASSVGLLNGGPEWVRSANFDIEAVIPAGPPALINKEGWRVSRGGAISSLNQDLGLRLRSMLRAMLDDRFNLELRREMREMPVYVLLTANGGPKLAPWKEGDGVGLWTSVGGYDDLRNGIASPKPYSGLRVGVIGGSRSSIADLASQLASMTGRPVLDETNLSGHFSYEFFFAPANYRLRRAGDTRTDLSSPSLFKALEDELGLKLEAIREKVEVFVIDNVEMPSEN